MQKKILTLLRFCHRVRLGCRETGPDSICITKELFNKAKSSKKGQAGSKQDSQEYTGHKEDRTKDNNPAGDIEKTGTIYRGETGVRHETLTRQEWLRAGEGNKTIKTEEKEETQEKRNRAML
ncbi:hypothetical protein EYF80_007265 [Liparis tanakae]|uniref:Uncharacterized protein n=1 Tax=Liparis tanakae TaxID=230148 RepID=A0A4Z2IWT4_9TELE|nr:hypothetical protein EYF80_007265 [Liparis tanakae]